MERRQRTNTVDSTAPTPQEAAASLDPLVQPINNAEGPPVYLHRQSSVFFIPSSLIDGKDDKDPGAIKRFFTFMERFSGILYALLASFLFTCSNFALKQFDVVLFDVLIIRYFIQAVMSLGFIIYKGYCPWSKANGLLILVRSLFAAGGSVSYYFGLTILPLPDLTTIRYTQVVWTAILAWILLHERINLATMLACLLTLAGVVCVAQPNFLFASEKLTNETIAIASAPGKIDPRLFGILLALLCALSISMSITLNKKLIQLKVQQSTIMFHFLCTAFLVIVLFQIHYWLFSQSKPKDLHFTEVISRRDFLYATIAAVLQIFPMILWQKSIKREHTSIVTVVQSSDILFAIILQNLFTPLKSNFLVLIGSTLVITSIAIVGGHKLWIDRRSRTCIPTGS